jgi:hypothetical protein
VAGSQAAAAGADPANSARASVALAPRRCFFIFVSSGD